MTKTEFLQELRMSLNGEVEASVIQETINYYSEYIDHAIAEGQGEETVLQGLGPARLIAKSIIEANSVKRENEEVRRKMQEQQETPKSEKRFTFHSWYGRLLLILLALVVVGIILALVVGAVVAVWYLLPVVAVIVLIVVLIRLFLRIGRN